MPMSRLSLQSVAVFFTALLPLLTIAGPAPLDVGAGLVAVLFLVHSAHQRDWQWLQSEWFRIALLLWAYMCLRNLFTDDALATLGRSASFLRYPLFAAALAHWVLPAPTAQRWLTRSALLAITLLALDCFWQYRTGTDIAGRELIRQSDGSMRLTGPLSSPRVGITMLWMLFPAALPTLYGTGRARLAAGVVLVLATIAIYLSGERMALLLLMLGLLLVLCWQRHGRRYLLLLGVIAALAFVLLSYRDPMLLTRQWDHTRWHLTHTDESPYASMWISSLELAQQRPLFGVGAKQFQPHCKQLESYLNDRWDRDLRCPMHPHHFYLEWLVEYGAIGLALFAALIVSIGRTLRPLAWRQDIVLLALVVALIQRLWPISIVPSQFVAWSAIPLWLMVGWMLARIREKKA